MKRAMVTAALLTAAAFGPVAQDRLDSDDRRSAEHELTPTAHPPLPAQASDYWYVPDRVAASTGRGAANEAATRLVRGVTLVAAGKFEEALPLFSAKTFADTPLDGYARYYRGLALAGAGRLSEAAAVLTDLVAQHPEGYLKEAGALALADALIRTGEAARAEDLLEPLAEEKASEPARVLVALGGAEEAVGHRDHALDAYRRVYYDHPLSREAGDAQTAIERLQTPASVPPDRYARELARAEQLFAARRWAQARAAFEPLARVAQRDDRMRIALRLAEADYYLDRHRAARDALRPLVSGGRYEAEARFFYLTAVRALGDIPSYLRLARQMVNDHPDSEWSAETLNNLASHHIIVDEDTQADTVFRELLQRFPRHRHAERAAWKAGWFAYRNDRFAETAEIFDRAAATFPRADYRPAWLYWSARAHDQQRKADTASARYRLLIADYQNLYYGRLAEVRLKARGEWPVAPSRNEAAAPPERPSVDNETQIHALAEAGLYDDAVREVQYAQRVWGDSPRLQATFAWLRHRQGLSLSGTERFNALRGAITAMRRAYPQFMAAGGEHLPPEVLRIIFPLDFWPLITKYAKAHDLDPFLVAALMAQESTFTPEIRSAANAYGLMQVIPETGRTVARQLGIRRFSTAMLTQPETNVRIGTKYFKDMVNRFGGVHYALAGYNAGPHRVVQWRQEAPGLPQDEFVDNIPFTETQTYVKRILGTAEDYRRLYGTGVLDPDVRLTAAR